MRLKPLNFSFAVLLIVATAFVPRGTRAEDTEDTIKEGILGEHASKPLVLYYSRTGHTKIVADELARQLLCQQEEIISKKSRHHLGLLNCVADQLFGFNDRMAPLSHTVQDYTPLVIASPLWMHKLASPVRTCIKNANLKDRDVYLFVTHRGNYGEADAQAIKTWLEHHGVLVKGVYDLQAEKTPEDQLRQETRRLVRAIQW